MNMPRLITHPMRLGVVVSVAALVMTGCATKPTYNNNSAGPTIVTNAAGVPNFYRVQRGDTVSQIAARYGLNYRQIGAINRLDSQYTIYTGQLLKLWQGSGSAYNQPPRNQTTQPAQPNYNTGTTSRTPNTSYGNANNSLGYSYPTNNQVIRNFDAASGNLGMWFAGSAGDPVTASQSGTVLYAGNGLAEYGNLIMIRHSDDYITAYAHNDQLLVEEGDTVQRGQRIATMGRTGQTDRVALEFQVRQEGNPIDPLAVLGR